MLHTNPGILSRSVAMLTGIRALIYDVDNCLTPLSNDDITSAWDVFFAVQFDLSLAESTRLRKEFFESVGCSATGFAQLFGKPAGWVDTVYAESAPASGRAFVARHQPVPRLAELFGIMASRGIIQMIVTQGHPDHYHPMLAHIGATPHIRPEHFIDRTAPHCYEKRNREVWDTALERLALTLPGLQPQEVMVFEDTPRNLVHPADMGMHTVLIGGREDPKVTPDKIHYRFDAVEDALELLTS